MGHTGYLGYNTESLKRIVYCCPTGVFYYTVHYTVESLNNHYKISCRTFLFDLFRDFG